MNKLRQYYIIVLWMVITVLSGCGYTTRSMIINGYQNIYVRPFVNKIDITQETSVGKKFKTYYPLLERDITREVINRFILDGDLRLSKEEDADLILEGELLDYIRDPIRYSVENNKEVEEYRLSVLVNLKLYDAVKGVVLWDGKNSVGDATYYTQGSQSKSEADALNEAVEDLVRRVVDQVVESW